MTEPLFIYVAGPYSAKPAGRFDAGDRAHDAPRQTHQNTQAAIRVAIELLKKGHYPYVPHLDHYISLEMTTEDMEAIKGYPEFWYHLDNQWLLKCNAFFYMRPSFGADNELKLAQEKGLRIFYNLDEVPVADVT